MSTCVYLRRLWVIGLMWMVWLGASATHNRAGEITYRVISANTIEVTAYTYTKTSNGSLQADRDALFISWGDGSGDSIFRINGVLCQSGNPNPCGVYIAPDVKVNQYRGTHTYVGIPAPPNNFLILSIQDPNRIDNIRNIQGGQSVNIPFYLEDTIWYPTNIQNIGYNNSPILLNPPIDYASVGDTFVHNPLAYDPDGDSLVFTQIPPLQNQGQTVPQYQNPRAIIPGINNTEQLDIHKGIYTWAVPQAEGIYNIAFIIKEYRRGLLLGTMIRDMQIIVVRSYNHRPRIVEFADTCVRAGDALLKVVRAADQDSVYIPGEIFFRQTVTLSGLGAPFLFPIALSPARFDTILGNPVTQQFSWNTICEHIRSAPYQVLFRAIDDYTVDSQRTIPLPLSYLKTWQIEVIPPPPLNLRATASKRKITLNWATYKCSTVTDFRGFSVWRKIDSNAFVPDYCETGLAGRGYTMIAQKLLDTVFIDSTVTRGQDWCYRVLAHFSKVSPNGLYQYDKVVSVPSNEACAFLPISIPVITNDSIATTDAANGQLFVAWSKPRAGGKNLDTILDPPPYRFDLYRNAGLTLQAPVLIHSTSSTTYAGLNDTTYNDLVLNTADNPYTYKVLLYAGADTIGSTDPASSVYLSVAATDRALNLNWQYQVPWVQDSFRIYRQLYKQGAYNYLITVPQAPYRDTALVNDSTYCYFVRAYGHYGLGGLKRPLINDSERKCSIPIDTIAPCPPIVDISNDCGLSTDTVAFVNHLKWHNYSDTCASDVVKYYIYYAPDTGAVSKIDSVVGINDTSYNHILAVSLTGCYVVTALDRVGNESAKTNKICVDDCPVYTLPNTFTPNGDQQNDLFVPIKKRFVTHVDFKIFNRWGNLIFETTDPDIKWDGKDQNSHTDVAEGQYIYSGYYYINTLNGEVKKPLPNKKGAGFIALIRGK
jgi:gliding motility-associated-like protein